MIQGSSFKVILNREDRLPQPEIILNPWLKNKDNKIIF